VHAPETVAPVTFLLDVISAVRKLKTAQELSLKTPLHTLTITGITVEAYNVIKEHEQYIYGTTFSNSMTLTTEICNTNSIEQKNNAWYATIKCPSIEEK
jgi:valyl-tRNA synthetase